MGDRANCVVKQNGFGEDGGEVFLYTHWGGHDLAETVQRALAKHWRWDDETYLTRIIFDEMVGSQQGNEIGFGISTRVGDNSYDYVVIDVGKQEVRFENPDTRVANKTWSFEDYTKATGISL